MPTSLAAADLVVCRSGASSSFELLAAGLPSVLVPSPFVTADHQTANARHLERAGAAVVVPDAELDGARLVAEVDALLADPARLAAMSAAARRGLPPRRRRRHRRPRRGARPWVSRPRRRRRARRARPTARPVARPARVHVANVGGAGMSAVATLLAEMGHTVRGHDPAATTPFVEPLRALGVEVATGPDRAPLPAAVEAVVTSTATPADDPDVVAAQAAGASRCCTGRRRWPPSAPSGARWRWPAPTARPRPPRCSPRSSRSPAATPGWVVGAGIAGLGRSAAWGGDGPLVVEADESDGTFLALGADAAIVTNLEPDHLEHWGGFDAPARRRSSASWPPSTGRPCCALDDPGAAGAGRRRRTSRSPTAAPRAPTTGSATSRRWEAGVALHASRTPAAGPSP